MEQEKRYKYEIIYLHFSGNFLKWIWCHSFFFYFCCYCRIVRHVWYTIPCIYQHFIFALLLQELYFHRKVQDGKVERNVNIYFTFFPSSIILFYFLFLLFISIVKQCKPMCFSVDKYDSTNVQIYTLYLSYMNMKNIIPFMDLLFIETVFFNGVCTSHLR